MLGVGRHPPVLAEECLVDDLIARLGLLRRRASSGGCAPAHAPQKIDPAFGGAVARRSGVAGCHVPLTGCGAAQLKGTEQFASMAHRFYSGFVERVIHYYVDRNLHHMVGIDRPAG
jgi:hypothetical protein